MIIKKLFLVFVLAFLFFNTNAQEALINNENADLLHQNGQIYLVVLVLTTIFAGIIFMLVRMEKKLNKLEKEN